ncbi:MAG: TetR/AcrR family transcriptional regulator [Thermoleophilia bacterium]|jgi:AcrR family transcriptional regulator
MAKSTPRMSAAARKQQIAEVTLDLIGRYGLQGTTMSRIAANVGITQAALYTHFDSRHDILLAALDVMYERIYADREALITENSLDTLRRICEHHREFWAGKRDRHNYQLLLGFIGAAPSEGLQEAMAEKHMGTVRQLAQVVEKGKEEGKIPAHVDPDHVAWLITGWALGGDVCDLIGLTALVEPKLATYWHSAILDEMFKGFANGAIATEADGDGAQT